MTWPEAFAVVGGAWAFAFVVRWIGSFDTRLDQLARRPMIETIRNPGHMMEWKTTESKPVAKKEAEK